MTQAESVNGASPLIIGTDAALVLVLVGEPVRRATAVMVFPDPGKVELSSRRGWQREPREPRHPLTRRAVLVIFNRAEAT